MHGIFLFAQLHINGPLISGVDYCSDITLLYIIINCPDILFKYKQQCHSMVMTISIHFFQIIQFSFGPFPNFLPFLEVVGPVGSDVRMCRGMLRYLDVRCRMTLETPSVHMYAHFNSRYSQSSSLGILPVYTAFHVSCIFEECMCSDK